MKTLFLFSCLILSISLNAQCLTRNYIHIADRVFTCNLSLSDFEGNFISIDTVNSGKLDIPSTYIECKNAKDVIQNWTQITKSVNSIGSYFNYYEMINNTLYNSPLHLSFLINSMEYTYRVFFKSVA